MKLLADGTYGIAALSVGALLIVAVGDWSYDFYRVLRIAVFTFSVAVVLRHFSGDRMGWLLFAASAAILFNPLFPIEMGKEDWLFFDLIFGAGFIIYGAYASTRGVALMSAIMLWTTLVLAMGLTYYVNRYMPHGPRYATGDVVCTHDDRGSCGEGYVEDMSSLDIPEWAKFLRGNFVLIYMLMGTAAIACSYRLEGDSEFANGHNPNNGR